MTNTPDSRQRLLVAGPDAEDRDLTARALSGLGYDVVDRAPSGLAAIEATARHRPDLVVVGSALPGPLDGPGTARAIDEIYGIPAVVVAEEGRDGFGQTPGSRPYVVLPKPFGLHDLEAAVESALRRPTPGRDRGRDGSSTAGRDELFAVLRPSGEVEYVYRDVDRARDPDPDPSADRGLTVPTPWRSPPPSSDGP